MLLFYIAEVNDNINNTDLIMVSAASVIKGVSVATIYHWIRVGHIKCHTITLSTGEYMGVSQSEIETFVKPPKGRPRRQAKKLDVEI